MLIKIKRSLIFAAVAKFDLPFCIFRNLENIAEQQSI
jgi:hypothetical protein